MPRVFLLFSLLALALGPRLQAANLEPSTSSAAQAPASTDNPAAEKPAAELSAGDAIVLGVVEGVTEYLPISSTGHLIIANQLLNLTDTTPLTRADGSPLWHRKPSSKQPSGEPLTLKLAADTFTVVIQFGAIASVAYLYWQQILSMLQGLLGRDAAGLRLLRNLLIAFVPAAAIGFLIHDWIDTLFSVGVVIAAQVLGALFMWGAERWRKCHAQPQGASELTPADLSPAQSFSIGALQCLSLWPGMSRSMTTIVGGYFVGLTPKRAAEFSFLLGLITLTAASAYKSMKSGSAMISVFGWPHIILGCIVAAVTAVVAVKFLVAYLSRHGLIAFVWYRLALAALLGGLMALGFF